MSRPLRVALDWALTIAIAVGLVLVVEHWLVTPYRVPSSSMEPTLLCARPAPGCTARFSDRVLACRICFELGSPDRGQIVVFDSPRLARVDCGDGGAYVKRLIGLPGETVHEDASGFIWIDGRRLSEPYIRPQVRRDDIQQNPSHADATWHVPHGEYFFLGDNRADSCDSRSWGSVPRDRLIGPVVATYWPPTRWSIR